MENKFNQQYVKVKVTKESKKGKVLKVWRDEIFSFDVIEEVISKMMHNGFEKSVLSFYQSIEFYYKEINEKTQFRVVLDYNRFDDICSKWYAEL